MEDDCSMEWDNSATDHSRTIVHIDIDCFYAQVEMVKNPGLRDKPLGIQQKNIVVTCNYVARDLGVKKCMLVEEAIKLCPKLVLVNGEDLHGYRQTSNQIHAILLKHTHLVEKLGMDENYIDVSDLVDLRAANDNVAGNVYSGNYEKCECGCHKRLIIGSQIAAELRNQIKAELNLTCCAGVSYNKLLAKLAGATHKPNQQTVLFHSSAFLLMSSLQSIDMVPGIGSKTKYLLTSIGVRTVVDLQNCDISNLKNIFDEKTALFLINLSRGLDNSPVKASSKPQTIGLEDGFSKISVSSEVKEKFKVLLLRLMILVGEDGRLPVTVKVTVRKYDSIRRIGHRQTKQTPIPSYLFSNSNLSHLSDDSVEKLLSIIMSLFNKIVDVKKSFHLTLLGLAFTKFQERCSGKKSIASFLIKERDISVQSVTSLVSDESIDSPSSSKYELSTNSPPGIALSDQETEPSPKKKKLELVLKKRKRDEYLDLSSPSKLRVADLSLDSEKIDQNVLKDLPEDIQMEVMESLKNNSGCKSVPDIECPTDVDPSVFKELPSDVQMELYNRWKPMKNKGPKKQNLILKYCIPNK